MKSKTPEEFIRAEIAINLSGEIDRIIAEGLGIKIVCGSVLGPV